MPLHRSPWGLLLLEFAALVALALALLDLEIARPLRLVLRHSTTLHLQQLAPLLACLFLLLGRLFAGRLRGLLLTGFTLTALALARLGAGRGL